MNAQVGDRLVLRLEGEIDIATAPSLEAALNEATASDADEVWVDLIGVRRANVPRHGARWRPADLGRRQGAQAGAAHAVLGRPECCVY